jgi:hypothetical protein
VHIFLGISTEVEAEQHPMDNAVEVTDMLSTLVHEQFQLKNPEGVG